MKTRLQCFLLAFAAALSIMPTEAMAQQQFFRSLTVLGEARRYLIHLPSDFEPTDELPVMMWFHGGGGNANEGVFEADFRSLSESQRFILVYAESYPDDLESCLCWGYEEPGGYTNGNFERDMTYVSAVIDDLVATYGADRNRVYGGGYSMGGSFAWDLACIKSDEFAALAPVAASCYPWTFEDCDAGLPTAICHILGTNDFYAPYDGGWVPSAAAQHAYWVEKNQANPKPEVVSLGGGVTRYTWAATQEGCHGVQHFRRQGGGHDVPGFAVNAIWDFVSQYDLDGLIECEPIEPPANDDCDGAIPVVPGTIGFDTTGATDSGIPSALSCSESGGPEVGADIWFEFIAPCTGEIEVSTCGSGFDTRIDVFSTACPTSGATPYACGDDDCGDDASVASLAIEGQRLLIRVGSRDGSTGEGVLQIACEGFEPPNPADLNGDGVVNSADLGLLIAAWNTPEGDLNGDGNTDAADVGLLIAAWS